jgi:hypothetical protein
MFCIEPHNLSVIMKICRSVQHFFKKSRNYQNWALISRSKSTKTFRWSKETWHSPRHPIALSMRISIPLFERITIKTIHCCKRTTIYDIVHKSSNRRLISPEHRFLELFEPNPARVTGTSWQVSCPKSDNSEEKKISEELFKGSTQFIIDDNQLWGNWWRK